MSRVLALLLWIAAAAALSQKDEQVQLLSAQRQVYEQLGVDFEHYVHDLHKRSAAQKLLDKQNLIVPENLVENPVPISTSLTGTVPYYLISFQTNLLTTLDITLQDDISAVDGVQKITQAGRNLVILVRSDASRDATTLVLRQHGYFQYVVETSRQHMLGNVASNVLDRIDQRHLPLDGSYTSIGTGVGIHLYVVDSGVLDGHDEFGSRLTQDYATPGETYTPCNFHGSWVASIAAGASLGPASSAHIHDLHVARASLDCGFYTSDAIDALAWIYANGTLPGVINLSWQGSGSTILDNLIADLYDLGYVIIAAAGNAGSSIDACIYSPARASRAISVGAVDFADNRASFSNYGDCVDMWAPGVNVIGASVENIDAYASHSGTSASSPVVAGVAAVYYSVFAASDAPEVTNRLAETATYGLVDGVDPNAMNNRMVSIAAYVSETTTTPSPPVLSRATHLHLF